MSITLTIELIELPEDERREQIENIGQNFPYIGDDPDELAHNLGEDASIMVQLYQKVLTHEQRDFLNRHEYVRTFSVREGGMYDTSSTTAELQEQMDLIESKPVQEHQHAYSVAVGPVTVRHCTVCGASWVLDGSHGWHWVPVAENKAVDQGRQRDLVYAVEDTVQRARDMLAPIYKDNTLNQVDTELGNAMDAILDLREMLGEE